MDQLAVIISNGFQNNQEYMDKRFTELSGEISEVKEDLNEVKKDLSEVKKDLRGVKTKLDTFIDDYKDDKLPMRVEYIENVLNLHKK